MPDLAEIGFRADTSELADAKSKLEALSPAASKAEKSSDDLARSFTRLDGSADKLMAAANGLSAATEKLNAILNASAGASNTDAAATDRAATAKRKKKTATDQAAEATRQATAAAEAAAAAARQEAAAVDQATAARKRYSGQVPIMARGRGSVGLGSGRAGPWGQARDNDNPPPSPVPGRSGGGFGNQSNPSNIAAQFQDIGVTAAMGMNPLLIALQQGTQLGMAMEGGVKNLGAAFKSFLGVTQIVTITLVALVAAGLQMVNWAKLAENLLTGFASILGTIAPYAALAAAGLALLYAPAILAGLVTAITSVGTLATAVWGVATAIYATVGLPILLIAGFIAIVAAANVFRDDLTQILGFDILDAAKKGANYIIGAFVAAYHDIQFLWKNFPDLIEVAAIGALNAVIKATNKVVGLIKEGVNTTISYINKIPGVNIPTIGKDSFEIPTVDDTAAKGRLAAANAGSRQRTEDDMNADYIGGAIKGIGNAADWASGKLKKLSDYIGQISDKTKKKKGGRHGKTDQEKFEDIVTGATNDIATLQAEYDTIGLSARATAELTQETKLLNQARQKGIELTEPQRAKIKQLAGDFADLKVATQQAKDALDFSEGLTRGFLDDFISGLKQGESVWKSFGDAALNALNKIANKLLDLAVNDLFTGGNSTGGFLGAIGKLFSGFGGGGAAKGLSDFAQVAISGSVGLFKKGGAFTNGIYDNPTIFRYAKGDKFGMMGEAGAEAVMPLKTGPDGSLGVQMYNSGGGSSSVAIPPITYAPQYNVAQGADPQAIEELRKAQAQDRQEFKKNVLGAVMDLRKRGANV